MDTASMGITLFNGLVNFMTILLQRLDNPNPLDIDPTRRDPQLLNSWRQTLSMGDYARIIAKRRDAASLSSLLNTPSVLDLLRCLFHAVGSADLLLQQIMGPAVALVDPNINERVPSFGSPSGNVAILRQHLAKINQGFVELYPTISSGRKALSTSNDAPNCRGPLYSIQSSFYDHPFNVTVEECYAEEIAKQLGNIDSDSDIYTLVIQEMAKQWVNDKLKSAPTVQDCGEAQSYVLTVLSSVLSAEIVNIEESVTNALQVKLLSYARLVELRNRVMKEIDRERDKRFSIAFCGLVKAGKSTLLNALIGRMVLPSGELPATACPCRIQHVKGKSEPTLTIDQEYFQDAIEQLRLKKPTDNNSFSVFEDDPNALDDLDPRSVGNRRRFGQNGYRIPGHASGDDDVKDLLMQVNDVIRLCSRLKVKLHPPDPSKWPRLEVEIEALRDRHLEGSFEFFDLPGLGELRTNPSVGYFDLETMVRQVAADVSDVVPVVSLKDAYRHEWRQHLPSLIEDGLGRSPELILCTHLDHITEVGRVEQLGTMIASGFKIKSTADRVLKCASHLGLGACKILRLSEAGMPNFYGIWEDPITHECAARILGEYSPERMYGTFSCEEWRSAVRTQLEKSNLQDAMERLVNDMIVSSPRRALKTHGQRLRKLLKAIIHAQRLASAQGSSPARFPNRALIKRYKDVLHAWSSTRTSLEIELKPESDVETLEARGVEAAKTSIETKMGGSGELIFDSQPDVEHFLRQVLMDLNEVLSDLKRKFVSDVRDRGVEYLTEHFTTLEKKIEASRQDALQDELVDELKDRRESVERLVFSLIRSHAFAKRPTKDARAMLHSIQTHITKLVDGQKAVDILVHAQGGDSLPGDELQIAQLGFMQRAPNTEISSSLPRSRLFTKRSQQYVVAKEDLLNELVECSIRPFCRELTREGKQTLDQMWQSSFVAARGAVNEVLEDMEKRYQKPKQMSTDARAVSRLLSFIAAEAALEKFQSITLSRLDLFTGAH